MSRPASQSPVHESANDIRLGRPYLLCSPSSVARIQTKLVLAAKSSSVTALPPCPTSLLHTSSSALASPGGKELGKPTVPPSTVRKSHAPPTAPARSSLSPNRFLGGSQRLKGRAARGRMMTGRSGGGREADGEWEVRPGGMLVQRRDGDAAIRVRVSHGRALLDVAAPAQATFGTHLLFCLDRPLPAWSLSLTRIGGVQSRLGSDLDRSTSQSSSAVHSMESLFHPFLFLAD
jgi:hypothetical protein